MSSLTLYQLTDQLRELEALGEDIPPEQLQDTLDLVRGDVQEKSTNVALYARNIEALADAVDQAAADMQARSRALRRRMDWIKNYLLVNMRAAGITKIEGPHIRLAVMANPAAVEVLDKSVIPAQFMVTPPPAPPPSPRPDKKGIAAAIKAGADVPGCQLVQGYRLSIKA